MTMKSRKLMNVMMKIVHNVSTCIVVPSVSHLISGCTSARVRDKYVL